MGLRGLSFIGGWDALIMSLFLFHVLYFQLDNLSIVLLYCFLSFLDETLFLSKKFLMVYVIVIGA